MYFTNSAPGGSGAELPIDLRRRFAPAIEDREVEGAEKSSEQVAWDTYIPPAKYDVIHAAVMNACDTRDGVKDAVLENPAVCRFDTKLLQCSGTDAPNCLTAPQVAAAQKIYGSEKILERMTISFRVWVEDRRKAGAHSRLRQSCSPSQTTISNTRIGARPVPRWLERVCGRCGQSRTGCRSSAHENNLAASAHTRQIQQPNAGGLLHLIEDEAALCYGIAHRRRTPRAFRIVKVVDHKRLTGSRRAS
jgi:hypothetical protein